MICQDCKMVVPDGLHYHPHLHCTIWKVYKRDPAEFLAEHGYVRQVVSVPPSDWADAHPEVRPKDAARKWRKHRIETA